MTTTTLERGPLLVSELPPVGPLRTGLVASLRERFVQRLRERAFERALWGASPAEQNDLLALARRS